MMPFAFVHLIGGWLLGKIIEFFGKKKISRHGWFLLLLGAILPDADLLLDWVLKTDLHRTFSHSFVLLITIPFLFYLTFLIINRKNDHKNAKRDTNIYSFLLFSGMVAHFVLDMVDFPGIPLVWPSQTFFTFTFIGNYGSAVPSLLHGSASELLPHLKFAVLDMALGTIWIFYLLARRKIKF